MKRILVDGEPLVAEDGVFKREEEDDKRSDPPSGDITQETERLRARRRRDERRWLYSSFD